MSRKLQTEREEEEDEEEREGEQGKIGHSQKIRVAILYANTIRIRDLTEIVNETEELSKRSTFKSDFR